MTENMCAVLVRRIGAFEYTRVPTPQPEAGEALVRVAVAGLCRTDLKLIEVGHRDLVLPRIPAEEVVGTVCAVGHNADSIRPGMRVYVYPGTSCGVCTSCRSGAGNLCDHMRIMGFHRDGGFAQYVVCPTASLIEIPPGLAFEHAVLAEPLSCCLHALEMAGLRAGERLLIWGAGPAGTLLARAARAREANPTVIDPDAGRRSRIGGIAAAPGGEFDVAIVAVGSAQAYDQALCRLGPRGRLVIFSGLAPSDAARLVDLNALHYREQTLVGAYGCEFRHGMQALDLIASGRVPVADLISHRFPLSRLGEALDLVRQRKGMKILMDPSEEATGHE
jgi:L-iditol 2-dehydrogenase